VPKAITARLNHVCASGTAVTLRENEPDVLPGLESAENVDNSYVPAGRMPLPVGISTFEEFWNLIVVRRSSVNENV
jgi:hypothetical protein